MEYRDFDRKDDAQILQLKTYTVDDGKTPLPVLKFPIFPENLVEHCFTTREGGVSTGIFDSMNLSFTRGDDASAVLHNYSRVAQIFGKTADDFVCSDQTHTTNVLRVDRASAGCGVTRERPYADIDGLITNEPGIILSTFYADCVPLFFTDPIHRAIGLSHSGWRGTVGRMGEATLRAMHREFGSDPKDVIAAVGPSICQSCYEVSEDVADAFAKKFAGHQDEILKAKGNGKYLLDLWKSNEIVLTDAGVQREHLAVTNICTCCNPSLLFSHRASHGKRGNLGAFMMLKS